MRTIPCMTPATADAPTNGVLSKRGSHVDSINTKYGCSRPACQSVSSAQGTPDHSHMEARDIAQDATQSVKITAIFASYSSQARIHTSKQLRDPPADHFRGRESRSACGTSQHAHGLSVAGCPQHAQHLQNSDVAPADRSNATGYGT